MMSIATYFYTASTALAATGVLLYIILSIWKSGISKDNIKVMEKIKFIKHIAMWCFMLAATVFIIGVYLDYRCI